MREQRRVEVESEAFLFGKRDPIFKVLRLQRVALYCFAVRFGIRRVQAEAVLAADE